MIERTIDYKSCLWVPCKAFEHLLLFDVCRELLALLPELAYMLAIYT